MRNVPGDAEVNHPVHHVEADEHDGEDDSAVLVNVTPPHTEDPVRRFGRRQGGERELYWLGVTVAGGVRGVTQGSQSGTMS